jgi:hypothetical protein
VVDLTKYKGIYFNDDNKKFQDEETGAHFEFADLCRRMQLILNLRLKIAQREQAERQKMLMLEKGRNGGVDDLKKGSKMTKS